MFPLDETSIDIENELETEKTTTLGSDLKFDFDEREFVNVDGNIISNTTDFEKVSQWFNLMLRTEPDTFGVYKDTPTYGVDTDLLIGNKSLPKGYVYSEIKREISEAAQLNPIVDYVYNFDFARVDDVLQVSFTAHLYTGNDTEVTASV